ncbi:MAG: Small-conductance mechanosensitive channel [Parcubacteria group bacterium GW2011_GWF2_44_8]|nr:MAG: Small-conductance mechanosensitive channel [Parcubacteria group bacterium GW2011_GWF2_44_8]
MLFELGSKFIDLFEKFWPKLPELILSFIIGYIIIRILLFALKRVFRIIKINRAMASLLSSLASVLMWIIFAAQLTNQLGLSGLSIAISGSLVALGFALANGGSALTSDIIAGLFLARDKDFEVGYKVKAGDIEGIIKKIDVRKVRIQTKDGAIHVLPNSRVDNMLGWTVIDRDPKN